MKILDWKLSTGNTISRCIKTAFSIQSSRWAIFGANTELHLQLKSDPTLEWDGENQQGQHRKLCT